MENKINHTAQKFTQKTPTLGKNHGRKGWREKNLLCEKLLQSL